MSRRAQELADWTDEGREELAVHAEQPDGADEVKDREPPEGHRWVFIVQAASWQWDDDSYYSSADGRVLMAFASRGKAEAFAQAESRRLYEETGSIDPGLVVVCMPLPLEE